MLDSAAFYTPADVYNDANIRNCLYTTLQIIYYLCTEQFLQNCFMHTLKLIFMWSYDFITEMFFNTRLWNGHFSFIISLIHILSASRFFLCV